MRLLRDDRGHRTPGHPVNLNRAADPLPVIRFQTRRGLGIHFGELLPHGGPPLFLSFHCHRFPHGGIRRRKLGESVQQRVRVKHCTTRENRKRAAGPDFRNEPQAVLRKVRDVIRFTDIADINQVVRHTGPLRFGRLGGPDIHSAVNER